MNWNELKAALLLLPISDQPVTVERLGVITDEKQFIKTHIAVVDKYPQINPRTEANNRHRLTIAKPHFDRLMAYYILKTQL
jgi:hypothetical protein